MSIRFIENKERILVEYEPEYRHEELYAKLGIDFDDEGKIHLYDESTLPYDLRQQRPSLSSGFDHVRIKVFFFDQNDIDVEESTDGVICFTFATIYKEDPDYWLICKDVFGIEQDVLIGRGLELSINLFSAGYMRRTSVMRKISHLISSDEREIVIGGDSPRAMPFSEYKSLLDKFPTTTELEHYGEAMIQSYISDYLETKRDYAEIYENCRFRKRRTAYKEMSLRSPELDDIQLEGLERARFQLRKLLDGGESVPEETWQNSILQILPVIFPQYIRVESKVQIKDVINHKDRELDFILIDARGNVDVLEIKKAFEKRNLIMKMPYRENYIPARELGGGVSQIEKYIHYLLNWGREGEKKLTDKFKDDLPEGLSLRFLNPRGLLLIGHCEFDENEGRDFDLICRQYSHVTDIITYDDLLNRLDRMIEALKMG